MTSHYPLVEFLAFVVLVAGARGFLRKTLKSRGKTYSEAFTQESTTGLRSIELAEEFLVLILQLVLGLLWVPFILSREVGIGILFYPAFVWFSHHLLRLRLKFANPPLRSEAKVHGGSST